MADEPLPVFVFGCVACGKTVAGTEKACPRCGASFDGVKFECPFCGELISPTERRCPSCGTVFGSFAEEVSETANVNLDGSGTPQPPAPTAPGPAEETVTYECPNCGKPVSESDTRCPHCGVIFS